MGNSNFDDYEELCGGLEKLGTAFENALDRLGRVHHRLVHAEKPVSDAGWRKFAEAYRKSATADAEQWEEWNPHPNGMACSYFFGRGSKANLDEFLRLADSGYALLLELAGLQAESNVPSDADIHLPERYSGSDWSLSSKYLEWLLVLHDTAMGCHTTRLRDHLGFWGYPQRGDSSPVEEAHMIEQLVQMWSGSEPDSFPVHPFTETLQHDLFVSSAEAIRIWLDPFDDELIPVGKGIEESPIYLPEANSVAEVDATLLAPIAPEPKADVPAKPRWDADRRKLWVDGKLIKRFKQPSPNQVAILQEFEARSWPPTIDDPLDKVENILPLRRLNDAVRFLNKHHKTEGVMRFSVNYPKVLWELAPFSGEQ